MKVNFPVKSKESIDFGAIDFCNGVILTKNPFGYIQKCDYSYYLYLTSDSETFDICEDSLGDFVEKLIDTYPDITAEYYEE